MVFLYAGLELNLVVVEPAFEEFKKLSTFLIQLLFDYTVIELKFNQPSLGQDRIPGGEGCGKVWVIGF